MKDKGASRIPQKFKSDIIWWLHGILQAMMSDIVWYRTYEMLQSDACLKGCGAICNGQYFKASFPKNILEKIGTLIFLSF